MSSVTEVSNALLKMQEKLTSLQTAVDAINMARESATDAVEFAVTLNNSADELILRVRELTEDIKGLGVGTRFDYLESSTNSISTGIETLEFKVQQLGQDIQVLNLGPKIEGLETSAYSLKVGVENLNLQLQLIEKNLQETIKFSSTQTNRQVEELGKKISQDLRIVKIISAVAILLALVVIVIILPK